MEALRRIPESDSKMRQARKKELRAKYLNKKFLVGPKSGVPKSVAEKLVEAAGSWSHLMNDSVLPDEIFNVRLDACVYTNTHALLQAHLYTHTVTHTRVPQDTLVFIKLL